VGRLRGPRPCPQRLLDSACDREGFASHIFGIGRGEVNRGGRDVVRLSDATKRGLRLDPFAEIAVGDACGVDAFRLDHAGVDGIDADFTGAQLLGEGSGDDIDSTLGGGVDRCIGRSQRADGRADIDDASTVIAEELERFLCGKEQTENIEVEVVVEGFFGDALERP